MKRLLLSFVLAALALLPLGLGLGARPASATLAPIGYPGLHCTTNHWMKDISDGGRLVGVDPNHGEQLTDSLPGYPTNHVFVVCSNGNGQLYLQNQLPFAGIPNGGRLWMGVNSYAHYAITASATAPGPHEAFAAICTGNHTERIHWAFQGSDTFTIATEPPTLWTNPPGAALPGTRYQISGVC